MDIWIIAVSHYHPVLRHGKKCIITVLKLVVEYWILYRNKCRISKVFFCVNRIQIERKRSKYEQKHFSLRLSQHKILRGSLNKVSNRSGTALCAMCLSVHQSAGTTYGSIKNNTSQLPEQARSANTAWQLPTGVLSFMRWCKRKMLNQTLLHFMYCWFPNSTGKTNIISNGSV